MVTLIENGDIFESKMSTLVCPVNCVGVMGKGLALAFKRRFPYIEEYYQRYCQEHAGEYRLRPGTCLISEELEPSSEPNIILFPTKDHWRNPSRLEWIRSGLERVRELTDSYEITSLAVPALGCGLGGLDWEVVRPLMLNHFEDYSIPVEVYTP